MATDDVQVVAQRVPIGTRLPYGSHAQINLYMADLQIRFLQRRGCILRKCFEPSRPHVRDNVERPVANVRGHERDDVTAGCDKIAGAIKNGQHARLERLAFQSLNR